MKKAMLNYEKAFSLWSENLSQRFKRLRVLLECKICKSQIIFETHSESKTC